MFFFLAHARKIYVLETLYNLVFRSEYHGVIELLLEERQYIELHLLTTKSKRQIGRELGRPHTTIIQELKRNEHPLPGVSKKLTALERAKDRDDRAKRRWRKSKKRGCLTDPKLRSHVCEKLTIDEWSPEQIAGSLPMHLPGYTITAKTIYNFVKHERSELKCYLRRHGKPYRQRVANRRSSLRQAAPDKRSISERPEAANLREEFGHWEGDTVVSGRSGKGGVLTLIERVSRDRVFFSLPNLKAETVIRKLLPFFQRLPEQIRKSLTLDNGTEFATSELYKLELVLKNEFKVFYCHPYRPQERGSVENANGWLRQYYPKGINFEKVTPQELAAVQDKLNQRPMKIHQWRNSSDVLRHAIVMLESG